MLRRLFAWLPVLLRRLASFFDAGSTHNVYAPAERNIYRYWAGQGAGYVDADPMVLFKRFVSVRAALAIEFKVSALPGHKDAPAAHDKAVRLIREIFDLKEFAQGGLTETEAIGLLNHFVSFCESVKKKPPSGPTSATETSPPSPPSPGDSPAISGSSDSGSTASDTTTGPPTPSPSGPQSPSASSSPVMNTSSP